MKQKGIKKKCGTKDGKETGGRRLGSISEENSVIGITIKAFNVFVLTEQLPMTLGKTKKQVML